MIPMRQPTGERLPAVTPLIGYGGGAYGAQTYGLLCLGATAAQLWPGVQITMFRRTYPELDGPGAAMQKAYEVMAGGTDTDGGREWDWENKSAFYFRHCQNLADVYKYQSQQIDILLIDEGTHFIWPIIDFLLTRNRASGSRLPGFAPFAVIASNPGNVGHVWYSDIYDVLKKQGEHEQVKRTVNPNQKPQKIFFIPALLDDNPIGVAIDPDYDARLQRSDDMLYRALRKGDWTVLAGQMFPGWNKDRIACTPFEIPDHWPRWRALDYGLAHPWVAGWAARDPQSGRLFIYRAVSKAGLTDTEQAQMMADMTPPAEQITVTYASPDMWAKKTEQNRVFTAVDEYREHTVMLTKADDDRKRGVVKIHGLLVDLLDGLPAIQVFSTYYDIFSCMESLIRDEADREDVLKVDGDDPFDMLKYLLTNQKLPERKPSQSKSLWAH